MSNENSETFPTLVNASINKICDDLDLISFVRTKCIEFSDKIAPRQLVSTTKPIANAVACAIVSVVNEDSRRKGRVERHLPDRMIGKVFGLDAVSIVYNKRLINSIVTGESLKLEKITS